jgi:hypothetical protein
MASQTGRIDSRGETSMNRAEKENRERERATERKRARESN